MIGPGSGAAVVLALLGVAAVGAAIAAALLLRRQRALSAALRHARERIAELEDESNPESFGTLVSHDLRAPIRVIEGFARIVKEDYAPVLDRIGVDHLERVLGAAARMNHMIDALLALSKLSSQPIARVPVDLSLLAGYIVEDLRRLAPERQVEVEVEIEAGLVTVGDPTLLRMVLENLLGNAWKYTGNANPARIAFVRHGRDPDRFTVRIFTPRTDDFTG